MFSHEKDTLSLWGVPSPVLKKVLLDALEFTKKISALEF